jgi:SAM-dependent methyltransferase
VAGPDPIFAHPRLADFYDELDGDRRDLDAYVGIAAETGARTVLDLGCGTGELAIRLAERGIDVTGVDPAAASLAVAQRKPGSGAVRWVHGDATTLPPLGADLAVLTGNAAQVFVDDRDFAAMLRGVRAALAPGGRLVFEVRDPDRRAWEAWTPQRTRTARIVPGEGAVESWCELLHVDGDADDRAVTFRWHFRFSRDGAHLTSDSTLRFRTRAQVEAALASEGFEVLDVRDAPDRPGLELVFLARRA